MHNKPIITRNNRVGMCLHCAKQFIKSRSDKKFCTSSCRSASHQMNNRKKGSTNKFRKDATNGTKDHLADVGKASVAPLAIEVIKKLRGHANGDILKEIKQQRAYFTKLEQENLWYSNQHKLQQQKINQLATLLRQLGYRGNL
jgi:hypothetical protein